MTPKAVKQIIADNPGKAIYARLTLKTSIGEVGKFIPLSKTRAIKCAKLFHSVQYGTYLEQRPDLNPKKVSNGDQQIVTFDASILEA